MNDIDLLTKYLIETCKLLNIEYLNNISINNQPLYIWYIKHLSFEANNISSTEAEREQAIKEYHRISVIKPIESVKEKPSKKTKEIS